MQQVPQSQITDPKTALAAEIEAQIASYYVIVDFVEVRIPLSYDPDTCDTDTEWTAYTGTGAVLVNRPDDAPFFVDLEKFARKHAWVSLRGEVRFDTDGSVVAENLSTPFESIESSLATLAVKIYPLGNPSQGWGPYVVVKWNPTKLLYGFNCIGRVCTLRQGIEAGYGALGRAAPELLSTLDIENARLMRVDCTSGQLVRDRAAAWQFLTRMRDIQHGATHAAGALPEPAARETHLRGYLWSVYYNPTSEHHRSVAYYKAEEVQKEIDGLVRDLRRAPSNKRLQRRLECLQDADHLDFVEKLVRLEGRMFRRGWSHLFERLGHAGWDGTVLSALDIEDSLSARGCSIVHTAWAQCWRAQISAMWGDSEMSLRDTDELFAKLRDFYLRHCETTRAANAGYRRAQNLVNAVIERGFQAVRGEILAADRQKKAARDQGLVVGVSAGIMSSSSWYSTLSELALAGVSKAALQALDGSQQSRLDAGVVVSLRSVVETSAVTELPAWFSRVVGLEDFDLLSDSVPVPSRVPSDLHTVPRFVDVDHDAGVPYTPTANSVWRDTAMEVGESVADFRARRAGVYRAAVERDLALERRGADLDAAISAEWAEMQSARAARVMGSAWYNGAAAN